MIHTESSIYKKTVLPSGLKIITESIPHVRSVSLGVWIDVGSRDEKPKSSGVSHFIEHMVFKGTKSRNAIEIASYLESVGGMLNAFTSREQTCYYAKFLDDHMEKAVDILADLITNAVYIPTDIEKEKKVILEEISDVEDSPAEIVHDLFASTIYGDHPLGFPILGQRETVKSMNRSKVLRFANKYYRPNKIIIAACGSLNHRKLVNLIKKYFNGNMQPGTANGRKLPSWQAELKTVKRKSAQAHICMGVPVPAYSDSNRPATLLLNAILGSGMSSRLFQHLREELGLVYSVYSYLDYYEDNGTFGVYLATDKNNVQKAVAAVRKQLDRIAQEPLPKDVLSNIKEQLKGGLVLGLENMSNRMNRLAKHEFFLERHITLDDTINMINSVTADQITDVAKTLFDYNKFSGVTLGPVKGNAFSALEN